MSEKETETDIRIVKEIVRRYNFREDIENAFRENNFSIVWENNQDECVWENKGQTVWFFISWVNAVMYVYRRVEIIEIGG